MNIQKYKSLFIRIVILFLVLNLLPHKSFAIDSDSENQITSEDNVRIVPSKDADAKNISTEMKNSEINNIEKGEIIEERTENSKVFYNGNGSYTKQIYFEQIFSKEKGEDNYEEISADLKTDQLDKDLIETENTKLKSNFLSKMENGQYATFEYNNHSLSFSILEATGDDVGNTPANDVEASYKLEDNQIIHKDIFPQIDLRNFTFNQNAKEDIILNSYKGYHKFTFKIDTDLKAVKTDKGSISFVDNKNKEVFNIPEPYMIDSNFDEKSGESQRSDNVSYELEKISSGYKLIVDADPNWLKDPERKFPVFIDPSTSISISTDTFVSSANPTSNYSSSSSKWDEALQKYVLQVGYYSSTTGTNYAYLINPIGSIYGLNITGATFYAYVMKHAGTTANGLWLDRTDASISPATVTWNTKPTSTNIGVDNVSTGQWATYNVTSTVQSWANGTTNNYGFKLHTNGNGQTYWKKIISSSNADYKPYLSVNYTIPTPTSKTYNIGDGYGYVDLSWNKVPDATSYIVWIYNGKDYEGFDVGNETKWSTKDQRIWPKTLGRYSLHHDKKGTDLVVDPTQVYKNSGGSYPTTKHYWFRISAKYASSESNMSDTASTPTIPNLEVPSAPSGSIYSNTSGGNNGFAELNWQPINGATGYKVWIYNGKEYEPIDVGNVTSWTTKNKGIWPTTTEITNATPDKMMFHTDGAGTELAKEPYKLYEKMGTGYPTSMNFYFRLSAYNAEGETVYSPHYFSKFMSNDIKTGTQISSLTPNSPVGNGYALDSKKGFIELEWEPVDSATGYKVMISNGKDYKSFDVGDVTEWSTFNECIWPTETEIISGRYQLHDDKLGDELQVDPSSVYKNSNGDFKDSDKYMISISAYNAQGITSKVSPITYITIPKIVEDSGDTSPTITNALKENGVPESDLDEMDPALQETLYSDGGEWTEVTTDNVTFEADDTTTGESVIVEAPSFEEVNQEINEMATEQPLARSVQGNNGKNWDSIDGKWKGATYVTYQGQTSTEYRYYVYSVYQWSSKPIAGTNDQFGVVWSSKAEKYGNVYSEAKAYNAYGGYYKYPLKYDAGKLYGAVWNHNWLKFPNISLNYAKGFGRIEIRVSKKLYAGTTLALSGFYYHPWVTSGLGDVSIGPGTLKFPWLKADKWRWDEKIKIKQ